MTGRTRSVEIKGLGTVKHTVYGTSNGWGACPECGHPQHSQTPCYRQLVHTRCACPAQSKEVRDA